jgi:hypothetical protein
MDQNFEEFLESMKTTKENYLLPFTDQTKGVSCFGSGLSFSSMSSMDEFPKQST